MQENKDGSGTEKGEVDLRNQLIFVGEFEFGGYLF